MIVSEFAQRLSLEPICTPDLSRRVEGAYTGDLLSWVMTRLKSDWVWVTIMDNVNVVAVASLSDASCVILCENAEPAAEVVEKALSQGINMFRTEKSTFQISYEIGAILYGK